MYVCLYLCSSITNITMITILVTTSFDMSAIFLSLRYELIRTGRFEAIDQGINEIFVRTHIQRVSNFTPTERDIFIRTPSASEYQSMRRRLGWSVGSVGKGGYRTKGTECTLLQTSHPVNTRKRGEREMETRSWLFVILLSDMSQAKRGKREGLTSMAFTRCKYRAVGQAVKRTIEPPPKKGLTRQPSSSLAYTIAMNPSTATKIYSLNTPYQLVTAPHLLVNIMNLKSFTNLNHHLHYV